MGSEMNHWKEQKQKKDESRYRDIWNYELVIIRYRAITCIYYEMHERFHNEIISSLCMIPQVLCHSLSKIRNRFDTSFGSEWMDWDVYKVELPEMQHNGNAEVDPYNK